MFLTRGSSHCKKEERISYLALSNYVQHKHAPGSKEADEFMGAIDDRIRQLAGMALVGVSGDHGMSAKSTADGKPNVLFLEHVLIEIFGEGAVRVLCPIKDPFVRQLGAMGPFVRVYLRDIAQLTDVLKSCQQLGEVEVAMTGEVAARELPIVLYFVGGKVALGTRAVQVLSVFSNIGLGNVCACIVFQILLRAFNSAIASDLSRLEWVWRLLLGIGIVLAALTLYAGLTIGETAQYKQWCNHAKALFATSAYWFLFDIAYYGINLNQSIILSRIRYSTSATPSEKLWKLAIGNLIVQSAKTPDEDRTISPVSTLESSSLTASAASDNNAGVVSLTVFSTPPGPESVPPAHTPPPPG
ncbi:uncharacterized protein Aud_006847 [Aspergillus udagawae]|uniref:Uncharacterized protein n=1 Tax=Aspergillus udagawae TaxID=91492 RepID=A0A8E0QX75_9EURO|nr:uncharacterized protein Aud_006847 [Aspergillus udagawae]GIC90413.1 hypothetical protein Aud_006847 [Aspergillus udagawae]